MLGCMRVGVLGLCAGLATAAARWRPHGLPGWRGEDRKLQREGKRAARSSGTTRGCHVRRRAKQEVACALPRWRAVALRAVGREKQRSREVGDEVWTDLQFSKSLGALL